MFVPLAISFFTFQQIALLIDANDGRAKIVDWVDFTAFVALFPQLIAGPIVLFLRLRTNSPSSRTVKASASRWPVQV